MKKLFLVTLLTLSSQLAFAAGGGDHAGNGGDMCEDRFKIVADDFHSWIVSGGSAGLMLPANITREQYDQGMLAKITYAKVSCTDQVVLVGNAEKTCKNFVDVDGSFRILCNTARFMATSDSDQYVLVHHEYAGLAGFEVNEGEASDYVISNQITGYLADQIVKKLVVKPPQSGGDGVFDPAICQGPRITQEQALQRFAPGAATSPYLGTSNFYQRTRTCNNLTGCGAWVSRDTQFLKYVNDQYNAHYYANVPLVPANNGAISFYILNGEVNLRFPLGADDYAICANLISSKDVICQNLRLGSSWLYNPSVNISDSRDYNPGTQVVFTGLVTNQCLRLSSVARTIAQTNGNYYDVETVWYGRF